MLAVVVGVNSVIALFYYARVAQAMWMQPAPDGDLTPIRIPPSLVVALAICTSPSSSSGVFPQLVAHFGDMAQFALGLTRSVGAPWRHGPGDPEFGGG